MFFHRKICVCITFLQQNIKQSETGFGNQKLLVELYLSIQNYRPVMIFVFNIKLNSLIENLEICLEFIICENKFSQK